MKKIYTSAIAAAAIFAAASCQQELAGDLINNEGGDFTVTAIACEDTKTVLDADSKLIYWAPGDLLAVFDADNKEVKFATEITDTALTADFTNQEKFSMPSTVVAAYPWRGAYAFDGTVISNFRIAGSQNAVAGSYDPAYAGAYGCQKEAGSYDLIFKSIHSLIKFTVGGKTAPTTVTLANNGMRMIAGLYHYNITTGEITQGDGAGSITLNGPFEVGQTYYIAVIPGVVGNGVSLSFDGEVVKNTGETTTLEQNTIYDLGTVEKAVAEPEPTESPVTRVWGKYATSADGWIVMGAGNLDRGMAMDNQYIYISKSTAYAPVIKAFNYDGTEAFDCNVTGMGTGNAWGDAMTYTVNCVRTMPKADGSYVLIACNLKVNESQVLEIWAWVDGPQAAPTCIGRYAYDSVANAQDHRRYGDRFDVKGTWEDGELWFPSMQADDHGKTIVFKTFTGVDNSNRPAYYYRMEPSQSNMKNLAFYPNSDEVFSTTNGVAKFLKKDGTAHSTGWENWTATDDYSTTHSNTFGYNFFEVDGKKYIAYVKIDKVNGKTGRLVVLEDGDGTLAGFKTALTENKIACEFPLQHESSLTSESLCSTGNTLGNCNVITVDGVTYIGAHLQGLGLSLFRFN